MTSGEALEYLRTSVRTLYRHLAVGDIPAMRVGHQWRFRRADLDQWVERQRAHAQVGVDHRTTQTPPPDPTRKPRVLIVDDEPAIGEMLVRILSVADVKARTAANGASALECIRRQEVDLLFTDLRMPRMDGTELSREAKRLRPGIKIVIVTGHPSQVSAIDAVNIGVDGYLIKPFHPMDVLMATARALNLGSMQGLPLDRADPR